MLDSPTYEEQAKLIEPTTESILAKLDAYAASVNTTIVAQSVIIADLQAKLAASEETVKQYTEAVAAFVRADVGLTNDPEADSYLDACQALHKLFTNPPSGTSALSENVKLRGGLAKLDELIDVQGTHGNWDYDAYMHGMFNGMVLARNTADGTDAEPPFRSAPERWGEDVAAVLGERSSQEGEGS